MCRLIPKINYSILHLLRQAFHNLTIRDIVMIEVEFIPNNKYDKHRSQCIYVYGKENEKKATIDGAEYVTITLFTDSQEKLLQYGTRVRHATTLYHLVV